MKIVHLQTLLSRTWTGPDSSKIYPQMCILSEMCKGNYICVVVVGLTEWRDKTLTTDPPANESRANHDCRMGKTRFRIKVEVPHDQASFQRVILSKQLAAI